MKKLTLILASVFAISTVVSAHGGGYNNVNSYADAFVFDEMGVTFSVYPDGEFDFYLPEQGTGTVSNGYVTATFNSGYNYDPYVQYDDFGAILQVENVPVYYDYYGRVSQIGDVFIIYRNRRVSQVGGLYVHYDRYGHYARHTGFINVWNPYFVYRPFYTAFCRPVVNLCFVRTNPYRQFYRPVRYTYYRPYVTNLRPCVATIGHTYRPSGYGVTHHRYTQRAGRGERAVVRSRRKVTTADASPRPSTVNRGRATTNARSNGTYNRSAVSTKPGTNRSSSSRTAKPNTSSRQAVSTKPRTVQSAPSRTQSRSNVNGRSTATRKPSSTVNRSTAPRTSSNSGVSRSNSSSRSSAKPTTTTRTQSASRPSSSRSTTSRQSTPSRSSVSSKPRSSSSTSRATSRPQTSSRSTASKPRTSSSTSRASSSSRGSSSVSKAPSRSSSSRSTSGGSAGKTTTKKRR